MTDPTLRALADEDRPGAVWCASLCAATVAHIAPPEGRTALRLALLWAQGVPVSPRRLRRGDGRQDRRRPIVVVVRWVRIGGDSSFGHGYHPPDHSLPRVLRVSLRLQRARFHLIRKPGRPMMQTSEDEMTRSATENLPAFAAIAPLFETHPDATFAVAFMGHAYGKAKFPGKCKITGFQIYQGEAIRQLVLVNREGRYVRVYTNQRAVSKLIGSDCGARYYHTIETDAGHYTIELGTWHTTQEKGWKGSATAAIEAAPTGAYFELVTPFESRSWYRRSDGTWSKAGTSSRTTTRQLLSSLSRNTTATLWRVR